jgi:hypothetical protein
MRKRAETSKITRYTSFDIYDTSYAMQDGPVPHLQQTEDALQNDVVAAQERLKRAIERFVELIGAVPGSLPSPAESLQIIKAGAERRAALANLVEALRRRMASLSHQTISDDLKIELPKQQ